MSTEAAARELEQATRRALDEAARCGHRTGPCVFCAAHADVILDAAEAYAASVAARMLDNFREGLPARKRSEGTLRDRLSGIGPQPVRLGRPARQP